MTLYVYQDGQFIVSPTELDDFPYYRDQVLVKSFEDIQLLNPLSDFDWQDITGPDWWDLERSPTTCFAWTGAYWVPYTGYSSGMIYLFPKLWKAKSYVNAYRFTFSTSQEVRVTFQGEDEQITGVSYYKNLSYIHIPCRVNFDKLDYITVAFQSTVDLNLRLLKIEALFTDVPTVKLDLKKSYPVINYISAGSFNVQKINEVVTCPGIWREIVDSTYFAGMIIFEVDTWVMYKISPLFPDQSFYGYIMYSAYSVNPATFYLYQNGAGTEWYLYHIIRQSGSWAFELISTQSGTDELSIYGSIMCPSGEFVALNTDGTWGVNNINLYRRSTSGSWTKEQIFHGGSTYNLGGTKDLCVDSNNKIHLLFYANDDYIYYLTNVTGTWVYEEISATTNYYTALLILIEDIPYHIYTTTTGFWYRKKISGSWTSPTLFYNHFFTAISRCYLSQDSSKLFMYLWGQIGDGVTVEEELEVNVSTMQVLNKKSLDPTFYMNQNYGYFNNFPFIFKRSNAEQIGYSGYTINLKQFERNYA